MAVTNIDVQRVIAVVIPVAYVSLTTAWLIMAWRVDIPKGNAELFSVLNTLLGGIAAWTGMIVGYYFNSSASSARKDEIIAQSQPPPKIPEKPL